MTLGILLRSEGMEVRLVDKGAAVDSRSPWTSGSGFLHHVSKPYDPEALVRLVASVGKKVVAK
jgi:hypothetical protein